MNRTGGRRGRRLSEEEREIWRSVTGAIRPLAGRISGDVVEEAKEHAAAPHPPQTAPDRTDKPPAAPAVRVPPLAPIDRKTRQRIARGTREIAGRLDLHGLTQAQAHGALLSFLKKAQDRSASVVLVITGKGERGTGERGVLKRIVPLWLGQPEFRALVIGYDDAAAAHGGEGALYVRVRRKRA